MKQLTSFLGIHRSKYDCIIVEVLRDYMDYETNFGKPSLYPTSFRHSNLNNKYLEATKNDTCKRLKVESNQNSVLVPRKGISSACMIYKSKLIIYQQLSQNGSQNSLC